MADGAADGTLLPVVTVVGGDGEDIANYLGRRLVITKAKSTIGRLKGDLIIPEDGVSGKHAQLVLNCGKVILRDAKSTNGTLIDGRKIQTVTLTPGTVFNVGGMVDVKFEMLPASEVGGDATTTAPAPASSDSSDGEAPAEGTAAAAPAGDAAAASPAADGKKKDKAKKKDKEKKKKKKGGDDFMTLKRGQFHTWKADQEGFDAAKEAAAAEAAPEEAAAALDADLGNLM